MPLSVDSCVSYNSHPNKNISIITHVCFRLLFSVLDCNHFRNFMCCTFRRSYGSENFIVDCDNTCGFPKCCDITGTLVFSCLWDCFHHTTCKSDISHVFNTFGAIACFVLHFYGEVYGPNKITDVANN